MQSINFHDVCLLKAETERGMKCNVHPSSQSRDVGLAVVDAFLILFYIIYFQLKRSWNTSQTLVLPSRASIVPRPSSNNLRLPCISHHLIN
jgi:isoprenylcysteine carboxyl methyltransferase (ICMT) family protein YpbQ